MSDMRRLGLGLVLALLFATPVPLRAASILFDGSKHEMAGNADWVVDADAWDLNMPAYPCTGSTNESRPARFPTPSQSGITSSTPETFWTGAVSSWAVDLVKAGHTIETLPDGGRITFGDGTNPQDLSNYKLFVVVEPQNPFTVGEKSAILAFVSAGGGLFMVGDHENSDRDCDSWDSPHIWNDLTGATSAAAAGLFGIWFRVGTPTSGSESWFDDGTDANVNTDPSDPIINGPFGPGTGGLGLFGSTSMELNTANNPSVAGHVWRTGQAHGTTRVTFATASYGGGRVAAIGDSSPADDGTGDAGDTLYGGWDKATGGVKNREIHLNACAWLIGAAPDTTPPAITQGPTVAPMDCSATVTWTTDESATSVVEYGSTSTYGSSASTAGYAISHSVGLGGLAPSSTYHYQVLSADLVGNGPTASTDGTFSTQAPAAPVIITGPAAGSVTGTGATITWATDEPSSSTVEYGTTAAYGFTTSSSGHATAHSVPLAGLTPSTTYHYRVLSTDTCGNGPTASGDATFGTGPAAIDIGGWSLVQFNSSLTYTFPSGTTIPSGGFLVVARDATAAEFQAYFPAMPAGTAYLNSNPTGSCTAGCFPQVNGGETYELHSPSALVDGPTVALTQNNTYQRKNPGDPAGTAASWNIVAEVSANPGQGAGTPSGASLVINEMADAADYRKEFIELYYDAGAAPPDVTPPAPITDLSAGPTGSTGILLTWTASGNDGTVGTAAAYDIRRSASRILSDADFAAATSIAGAPAPHQAGHAESFTVNGLSPDTPYYFALRVADQAGNTSGLSNSAGAVTAPTGGAPTTNHLVVSQVQTAGDGSPASDDEFIELYNPTSSAASLGGLSVQYKSATGTTYLPLALPSVPVQSHGWYLIARSAYNGTPAADATNGAFLMAAAGGNIFLVSGTTALPSSSCSTSASIIDKVAWGTGNCPEGTAAPAPTANGSIGRKPGGTSGSGQDTNVNSQDFQTASVSAPHNAASAPANPPSALGNVRATLFLTQGASGTTLQWARAAGASAYHVYRGTTPDFMTGSPSPWSTTTPASTLDASVPARIYFYVVRATDGSQDSAD
jgi:hypothetical protein